MENQKKVLDVNIKSFISSLVIMVALMIIAYVMTLIIPSGMYEREVIDGQELIVSGSYARTDGGIELWRWILSPFLLLGSSMGFTVISICIFLMVIGGAFSSLDACGVLRYMLSRVYQGFADKKYVLMIVLSLFFMLLGTFAGSFEEVVPLVPLTVALSYAMGWDALLGLGMSILAVCCGFSAGVGNPFTVGVAQQIVGLPMFSGMWYRAIGFVVFFTALIGFLFFYAKRIEKDPSRSLVYDPIKAEEWKTLQVAVPSEKRMDRALLAFGICIGLGIAVIILSTFIKALQGYLMIIVALAFLLAGTSSVLLAGFGLRNYLRQFGKGILNFIPGVLVILMASSVRYTLEYARVLDTILNAFVGVTAEVSSGVVVLLIYGLVLLMNFFIPSASAKAFLLMPLIAPIAQLSGVSLQVAVLAFAFGDGFSNTFYPTNPVLLISLGLSGVSYGKWAKWSIRFQLPILVITCIMLIIANGINY